MVVANVKYFKSCSRSREVVVRDEDRFYRGFVRAGGRGNVGVLRVAHLGFGVAVNPKVREGYTINLGRHNVKCTTSQAVVVQNIFGYQSLLPKLFVVQKYFAPNFPIELFLTPDTVLVVQYLV
jgi:hypothetical protein